MLRDEFLSNHKNHTRSGDDIQRIVFSYIALAEKRGRLRYVTDKESMHVGIHKKRHYERLERNRPMFFCMNDSEYATDEDRLRSKATWRNGSPGNLLSRNNAVTMILKRRLRRFSRIIYI